MKKWMRRIAIVLGALIALLAIAAGVFRWISSERQARRYDVERPDLRLPEGRDVLAEGERLYVARGCRDCHAADGGGKTVIDAPPIRVSGSNLTEIAPRYTNADLAVAIREGVAKDGRALLFMPSHELHNLGDRDVGHLIAYIRTLPRVERTFPKDELRLIGNVLHVLGMFPAVPAELIDRSRPRPPAPEPAATAEYGAYLAAGCTGCHGTGLSGGPIPGAPPELGTPSNLTQHASGLRDWTLDDFRSAMREGKRPDGRVLDPEQMPWPALSRMSDVEIEALWAHLRTVPALAAENR
jgi:cytochrome c553